MKQKMISTYILHLLLLRISLRHCCYLKCTDKLFLIIYSLIDPNMTKTIKTQDVFHVRQPFPPCMVDVKGVGRLYVLACGHHALFSILNQNLIIHMLTYIARGYLPVSAYTILLNS